jgi:hypothetical protein
MTLLALLAALAAGPDDPPRLELAEPIPCRVIRGYEDFEPLEEARVEPDGKLPFYLRPSHLVYQRRKDGRFDVHLLLDVNVRRPGKKAVLWGRKRLVDYEAQCDARGTPIYLEAVLGPKGLARGEYEVEFILHDALSDDPPATQTLTFRVVEHGGEDGPQAVGTRSASDRP